MDASAAPFARPSDGANPWRTTGSRAIYANPWIRVREDAVVRPDGASGIYGVVSFATVALGAVPVGADGTTVLVGQHRYTLDAYTWEIPEGGGDPGKSPREEMARELAEETGLRGGTWTDLGGIHTSNSVTDEVGRLYLVEDLTQAESRPEGTEVLQLWRLPLAEAAAMAASGELTDSLTVAGLLRAERLLRQR